MPLTESELIHDWSRAPGEKMRPAREPAQLDDETLPDGLQSPSVRSPAIGDKLRILQLIAEQASSRPTGRWERCCD